MILQRTILGRGGQPTLGALTSRDGAFSCVTLERSVDGEHPCIPAGVYRVSFALHHGAYRCPALIDVAGRSGIQIHVANCCAELLGCIAVGERVAAGGEAIEDSQAAFDRMMGYLRGVAAWELEVVDPAPRAVARCAQPLRGVSGGASDETAPATAACIPAAGALGRRTTRPQIMKLHNQPPTTAPPAASCGLRMS